MQCLRQPTDTRGFTLVEIVVVIALVALVFGGLFASVNSLILVINNSKSKAAATALMTERLEYIRSLSYNSVGTIGAPPYGPLPQQRQVVLNGETYYERVIIDYVDDPADGSGGSDENTITSDYKRVEIVYEWDNNGATSSISNVSTVVPEGIETDAGGGSLRVNVFNANAEVVEDARVTVINTVLSTTTNTFRDTNADGQILISGLPGGGNYEIYVTKTGYSSDQTYAASSTNPNPITPLVAIATSSVSTMNFQIDELSDFTIQVNGAASFSEFSDSFTTAADVFEQASTTLTAGAIVLTDVSGSYETPGTVLSTTTTPSSIDRWYAAQFSATTSASTSVAVSVYYDDAGALRLVPDSDLPGNSVGFTSGPIDLESLSAITYPTLALGATLTTVDASYTPELGDWRLRYVTSQPAVSGVTVQMTGSKTIGTDAGGQPVYKFDTSYVTDGSGEINLTDIEYDLYTFELASGASDILEVCPRSPYFITPNTDEEIRYSIANLSGSFLQVYVQDPLGEAVPGAMVRLQNSGYDEIEETSLCGQVFFNGSGLYNDSDYTMTVSASGFGTEVVASTSVSNTASTTVTINPL